MVLVDEYLPLYTHLRGEPLDVARLLNSFRALPPATEDSALRAADKFFEAYGVGNLRADLGMDQPALRLHAYELLLECLVEDNSAHYRSIHKGTPYYFLGWTAFQIGDFARGAFYLDSAISEDLRVMGTIPDLSSTPLADLSPSIRFLLLDPTNQVASDAAERLVSSMDQALALFSALTSIVMTRPEFVERFIKGTGMLSNPALRTIATCFYSFILEFESRQRQLKLRSSEGGSIEPFLTHLFKGCLVLESLLKLKTAGRGKTIDLRHAISLNKNDLELSTIKLRGGRNFDGVVQLLDNCQDPLKYPSHWFEVAYGIRNTTGHQLHWPDVFKRDDGIYQRLYEAVLGTIFWTIHRLW